MSDQLSCPNCGSENIEPDHSGLLMARANPSDWNCQECGYTGPIVKGDKAEFKESKGTSFNPQKIYLGDKMLSAILVVFILFLPIITIALYVTDIL